MELDRKIGLFSDIHLGLNQDDEKWHDISLNFAKWASETYSKLGIKQILIPGDIFHNRNEIGVNTLSIAKHFFDYFKEFKIFISTGNHCCFFKHNSDVNSISILDGWENIKIFDKTPAILKYKNKKISMIPWGVKFDEIPETDICVGHFEINTFYMNSFKVCENGISSNDIFKKSKYIISGHFHKKDHRKYSSGDILYLGSPYQQNFGDSSDKRGIYIFDLNDNTFEFIENDFSPKFVKLKSDCLENKNLEKDIKNNFVSLSIDSSIEDEKINNILNKIQSFSPNDIKTEYIDTSEKTKTQENQYDSIDILKNIYDYVETLDIDCKEEIINYLTETYNNTNK